jgi:hypothetical protein
MRWLLLISQSGDRNMGVAKTEKPGPLAGATTSKRKSAPPGALQGHARFLLRCGCGGRTLLAALLVCCARDMVSNDLVFDLVIGGLRNNLLG